MSLPPSTPHTSCHKVIMLSNFFLNYFFSFSFTSRYKQYTVWQCPISLLESILSLKKSYFFFSLFSVFCILLLRPLLRGCCSYVFQFKYLILSNTSDFFQWFQFSAPKFCLFTYFKDVHLYLWIMVITAMIKPLTNNFNIWVISELAQHLLIISPFENLSHFSSSLYI